MEIRVEHFPEKSVIIIERNKLIGIEHEVFQNLVRDSINRGSQDIVINLSNVEYISGNGLGILVHAYMTCKNRNVKFNIESVNSNILNVFQQTKLDMLFNIT